MNIFHFCQVTLLLLFLLKKNNSEYKFCTNFENLLYRDENPGGTYQKRHNKSRHATGFRSVG